jgi:hypothetical protein
MKKTLLLLAIISLLSCKAQVIIPLNNAHVEIPNGAYLMDTEYELNKYIGTWKYQNGNEVLIITLAKILQYEISGHYEDMLIGEYKYIDSNGVTIINTLPNMTANLSSPLYHKINFSIFKYRLEYPNCLECEEGEIRIKSYFEDPERSYLPTAIIFRWINPTTIKAKIYSDGMGLYPEDNSPTEVRVPQIEYTLIKQ